MKIGIVGGGVVGRALARCYLEHAEVMVYDIIPERSTHSLEDTLNVGTNGLVFICLPTPAGYHDMGGPTGMLELAIIEDLFAYMKGSDTNIVIRSTLPIGSTNLLRHRWNLPELAYSPEFLTSRCSITDAQIPARNIIGSGLCRCASVLGKLYERRFPGVPTLYMSSTSAEAVKLITNAYFGTKVSFFNEARSLCDKLGIYWDTVLQGILSDGRISHSHTQVPGPDGQRGFGGACLPKDLECLVTQIEDSGLKAPLMRAALERNKLDRGDKK